MTVDRGPKPRSSSRLLALCGLAAVALACVQAPTRKRPDAAVGGGGSGGDGGSGGGSGGTGGFAGSGGTGGGGTGGGGSGGGGSGGSGGSSADAAVDRPIDTRPTDGARADRGPDVPAGYIPPTFEGIQLVLANCIYCHPGENNDRTSFDGFGQALYDRLTSTMPNTFIVGTCAFKQLIVKGNPDQSLIYVKISGPPATCGVRMPKDKAMVTKPELDAMRGWIMAGAPMN
jgi:hypothetical protein